MARYLIVKGDNAQLKVELGEGLIPDVIWSSLPFEGMATMWGDSAHFSIPVFAEPAPDAKVVVEVGDVAYWKKESALFFFLGRTPKSVGDKPAAPEPVSIVGKVVEGLEEGKRIKKGEALRVEGLEE